MCVCVCVCVVLFVVFLLLCLVNPVQHCDHLAVQGGGVGWGPCCFVFHWSVTCVLSVMVCLLFFLLSLVLFVCIYVLRPSQHNGVMSSAVNLSNHVHTFYYAVNTMGSCRVRSIYLTTLLLGGLIL